MCVGVNADKIVTITHCQRASQWNYDAKNSLLKDSRSGLCMSIAQLGSTYRLKMVKCNAADTNQHWNFTFYRKSGLTYDKIV